MVLKADQVRVKALLAETITLLCKNGLHFKAKFSIQALIGITLDEEDIFLVNINETIESKDSAPDDSEECDPFEQQQPPPTGKRLRGAVGRATSGPSPSPASPGLKSLGGHTSIPKLPSNSHSRTMRVTRQSSPHSVAATRSSEISIGTRAAETSIASGIFGDSLAEQTGDSLPSSNVGLSEAGGSNTFPAVSIKNDSQSNDTSYDDSKPLPEESDLPEEPSSKRLRLRVSDIRPEPPIPTPTSSESRVNFASSVDATKSEPTDVIEIKEESYSDSESQMPNYSAYGDYNSAMYGGGNADMTHAFGEASMFQAGSSFFVPQSGEGEQTPESHRLYRLRTLNTGRHRGAYACQKCDQTFTWKTALRQHENNIHRQRPHSFLCPFCSKGFWNQRDLRGHMAAKHEVQKEYPCPNCGREYSYKGHLTVHLKVCRSTSV